MAKPRAKAKPIPVAPGERRKSTDRRTDERRAFPPRPEGRRLSSGRRVSDPSND